MEKEQHLKFIYLYKSCQSVNPINHGQTSYNIIKAHGGELKVENGEGAYAEFIIQLPIK